MSKKKSHRALVLATATAAALASSQFANAVTFNFIPAAGMSQQAIDGFAAAGERWSAVLSDTVTVNMNIDFTTLGAGILGSTGSTSTTYTWTNTRTNLLADRVSTDDFTASGFWQAAPANNLYMNYTLNNPNGANSATPYLDNNGNANNTTMRINNANAKAIGVYVGSPSASDASISFSNSFTWDFDPKDGITAGAYDFVGVATHEIGHALGFVSATDIVDGNSSGFNDSAFTWNSIVDLYKYSALSFASGPGVFDISADTRTKYFSIDGGTTNLTTFSTGVVHGDGRQGSHWKDNLFIGIMDPTAATGEQLFITNRDRQLYDVIGYQMGTLWSWIDPLGGSFNAAIRWASTIVPTTLQDANFKLNNTYSINFTAAAATANAFVHAGTVTFNLTNGYTITNALNVGPTIGDNGTLNITTGTVSAATANIGGDAAAAGGTGLVSLNSGNLTVSGITRVWTAGTLKWNGGNTTAAGGLQLNGGKLQSATTATFASNITSAGGTIQTDAGTFTTSGTLTTNNATTLTKTGAGTWTIGGTQSHGTGAIMTLSAGITNFSTNAGAVGAAGKLALNANAVTNFNATQNLASLAVGAGAVATLSSDSTRSIKTASLSVNATGKLDLRNNRMAIDYTGGTIEPTIRPLLASGFAGGALNGFGINTTQPGLFLLYGVGSADASDVLSFPAGQTTTTWGGQTVDTTTLLLRYTYLGDANLDGLITADDYALIDFFSLTPGSMGYRKGDFNYDNTITADDYAIIDSNIIRQTGPLGARGLPGESTTAGLSAVPEPGSMMAIGAAAGLLLRRRRR